MLVSDVVNNTLTLIDVISAGDTAGSQDSTLALSWLNLYIDALNAASKKQMYAIFDPILFTFNAVANFVNPGDTVTLPAGWPRALQYMAAVDLGIAYDVPLDKMDRLREEANVARAAILTPPAAPA